jgi:Ni,Fe-hydrogenase III component G
VQQDALTSIREAFGTQVREVLEHNERRAYVTVDSKDIPAVCRYLHERLGGRLATATGLDTRSGIEILYYFMLPAEHRMITVKTKVKKPSPEIESIGVFLPAAIWIEREITDILGVRFLNHPDMRRLIMADDWPENTYPLRRDFKEPEP